MPRDTKAAFGFALSVFSVIAACSVDDRVLSVQALECEDDPSCAGSNATGGVAASGGRGNSTGGRATSQGGSLTNRGGDSGMAGSSGAGADGTVSIVCPDLDDNTVPDCDETLASNATFNLDIEGWRAEANATVSWSFINAQAGEKSGSILVESNAPANTSSGDAFIYTGVTQCLPLEEGSAAHQIFAQMFSEGEAVTGYGSVVGRQFASADCSGSPLSVVPSPNQGNTGNWFPMQTALFMSEPGAKSLLVELRVGKLATRTGSVSLRFDNVMVR